MHECKKEAIIEQLIDENKSLRSEMKDAREHQIRTDTQYSFIVQNLGELKEKINSIVSQPAKMWWVVISAGLGAFTTAIVTAGLVLLLKGWYYETK